MLSLDVTKRRRDFVLEARIETQDAGVIALFGPSGCGKTTLVDLLAGLDMPDSGRIKLGERVLFDAQAGTALPPERRRIGYVFQDSRLFPHMSVRRNLQYGMPRRPRLTLDRVVTLLDIQKILDRRPAGLSGGEKQRVAIGRALLTNPDLLLMDEPLASLDPGLKGEILPFIGRLQRETGIPVVYVTHVMEEIVEIADTLVLMEHGRVLAVGPVEALLSRLDLRGHTGPYGPGVAIVGRVSDHDEAHHLTHLAFDGGVLSVPRIDRPLGTALRLRIRAADVVVALEQPTGISTLNILQGRIRELQGSDGPRVDVLIDAGVPIWAQVTPLAVERLGLKPGLDVFALIKAVAIGGDAPVDGGDAGVQR